jgi:RNA polymerase sigma factor (sigma-70 family)
LSEDAELMRRVQAGDEAAFAALMAAWELPVKRLIGRLVPNAAEAEDLAQEAFVRVWQQRARFRAGAEFRPWLFAVAVNLARNRLRWWRRRPTVSLEDWGEEGSAGDPAAGQTLELRERAEAVRAAVARLPREQRETLILFEYEGLSHAEIAAALGGTAKGAEARLYRARAALRGELARWLAAEADPAAPSGRAP